MKRLFAMLLSLIFAISNNVGYVASSWSVFDRDRYYTFEDETAVSPRDTYARNVDTGDMPVSTSIGVGSAKQVTENGKYWFVPAVIPDMETLADTSFKWSNEISNIEIVCPENCIVVSGHGDECNNGHTMVLQSADGKYKLTFENLERDFTNRTRPSPEGGMWRNMNDCKGLRLDSGQSVGLAQSGTVVTVVDLSTNKQVSLDIYYGVATQ